MVSEPAPASPPNPQHDRGAILGPISRSSQAFTDSWVVVAPAESSKFPALWSVVSLSNIAVKPLGAGRLVMAGADAVQIRKKLPGDAVIEREVKSTTEAELDQFLRAELAGRTDLRGDRLDRFLDLSTDFPG